MKRRFSVGYINFEHVCKYYQTGDTVVKAVDDVNFTVEKGEFCVVLGPSGAGKTTILNLLGGMDKATSGTITVGGKQITGLRGPQLTDYRRTDVGFVFQFYNLMPNLTALENVELARQVCKDALDPKTIMEQVGLGKRMNSSACPSPARCARIRRCCCATSRPARWIPRPACRCSRC